MTSTALNSPFRGPGGKIFLIGFMGSGKTYWGKKWARQCGYFFYDLDAVIEKKQGRSVASIFEKDGEAVFRELEEVALMKFGSKDNCLVACGGGTPCYGDNMQWMNENGITVYLQASPQYIYDRVLEETAQRPLMKQISRAELLFFIEQKLKERESFYNQAKIILPVQDLDDNFVPEFK
jgi:shikimate kinase